MSDSESLIKQANRKLDENDFAGARDDYRSAALIANADNAYILNLDIAEDLERLEFRRKLKEKHPNSLKVLLDEAFYLRKTNFAPQAIDQYSKMLNFPNLTLRDKLRIYLDRFHAACSAKNYPLMVEDFKTVWLISADSVPNAAISLLAIISEEVKDIKAISVLETLASNEQFPDFIKEYLIAKTEEIRKYQDARERLR